ncbi:MAG: hypothetical protein HWE07_03605 [Cytophagia bacterium]|nr:hypothetical protein [Cytophagia bacterium]
MRTITITLAILACSGIWHNLFGQISGVPPKGPVSLAMGGVSSATANEWSVFNNPAGLIANSGISGIISYQTIFNFAPFNTLAAGINAETLWGNAAFGVYRFGDELFSNQMASLGFARKIGIMSLGAKANLLQYHIDGFGKRSVFVAEMGALAEFSPQLNFGVHVYNFTQSVIAPESQERVPTLIRLSLNYHPDESLDIFIEGEKDVENTPDFRLGLAYSIMENLWLRTGFSTLTNRHSFGAGFKFRKFTIDYAIRSNKSTGATHNFGLTYQIKD